MIPSSLCCAPDRITPQIRVLADRAIAEAADFESVGIDLERKQPGLNPLNPVRNRAANIQDEEML
jgi:hypothetical protein